MGVKEGWEPLRARVAWTRWAFDSGMSQSGRVVGTVEYSYAGLSISRRNHKS